MSGITLPRQNLVRQWMAQYGVPAVGIGLVAGDEVKTINVYGELSKGITAPQNTVWGSKALADAFAILDNEVEGTGDSTSTDLFTKLDMPDTTLGNAIAVLNRLARPHNIRNGIYVFKPYDTKQHLFTTVGDFCKLLIHINQQPNVAALLSPSAEAGALFGAWKYLAGMPGDDAIFHAAAGNGASHFILLLPQSNQAMVIFTNSDNGGRVVDCILKFVGIEVG